jgi:hypothetical protein
MPIALKQLPSPIKGEGSGGVRTALLPPIPTFPPKGGRGLDLPLSAPSAGEGKENDASLANRMPNTIDLPPLRGKGY